MKLTTHNSQPTTQKAFLATEMLVALSILGILMAGLAVTLHGVGRFHRLLWCRQQCLAAGQALLVVDQDDVGTASTRRPCQPCGLAL